MRTSHSPWSIHRQAWSHLRGPLAWWFVPGSVVTLALAVLGWWGIASVSADVSAWILERLALDSSGTWAKTLLEWLIWALLLVVKLKLTKYIVLVVMGPLFAAVSEAAETQITGRVFVFSWSRWVKDAIRGMRSAVLLAVFEWSLTAVLWLIGLLVPLLSPVVLPLAWLLGAWAYGASAMDYVWEREGKGAWEGLAASLRQSMVALNVGIPFSLWMSIPLLAWTVGPLMGGMGAAATACVALREGAPSVEDHVATT